MDTSTLCGPNFPRDATAIVDRIRNDASLLGSGFSVLGDYLSFADASPLLQEDVTADQWNASMGDFAGFGPPTSRTRPVSPIDHAFIVESMRHYAAFGWTKVHEERSISACRTIEKMEHWLWLLGYDDPDEVLKSDDWGHYGDRPLRRVCTMFGFPVPT